MFGTTWRHDTIRKYVVLFGTLFNDIYITRRNSSSETIQTLKVPLSYGPKEKFLARLDGIPTDDGRPIAIVLPRMSFQIENIYYDPQRKLSSVGQQYLQGSDKQNINVMYNPVPYDLVFSLSIMVKNEEDGTQILEQILSSFGPEFTVTSNILPQMGRLYDIPIIFDGDALKSDTYEGSFEERRTIVWTLRFTVKGWFFGPVRKKSLIKIAEINLKLSSDPQNYVANTPNTVHIEVKPGLLANGSPTSNASLSIDYTEISADDDFGFITTITENL